MARAKLLVPPVGPKFTYVGEQREPNEERGEEEGRKASSYHHEGRVESNESREH